MVTSGDNIFEGIPECKSQLFFDRQETFSLQGEKLKTTEFTFERAHMQKCPFGKSQHDCAATVTKAFSRNEFANSSITLHIPFPSSTSK